MIGPKTSPGHVSLAHARLFVLIGAVCFLEVLDPREILCLLRFHETKGKLCGHLLVSFHFLILMLQGLDRLLGDGIFRFLIVCNVIAQASLFLI